MRKKKYNILLVEDEVAHSALITRAFADATPFWQLQHVKTIKEAKSSLAEQQPDLMLLDNKLPDGEGLELLPESVDECKIPIIMMTAYGDEKMAVKAIKAGALDYVVKSDLMFAEMPHIAERALREWNHIFERKQSEELLSQSESTIRNKLKAITEPEGDIGTLKLADIIDIEMLKSMMEDFYQLTGMLGAVLDISGNILVAVGWQDVCIKFHRCQPDACKNCIESDTILTSGVPEGTFKAYKCKNNMWDMVTPIIIGEKHLGNVFIGQFFYDDEMPDLELFRKQAEKFSFDEKEYFAALERVPRFTREEVNAGMHFYANLALMISKLSFSAIQQSRMFVEQSRAKLEVKEALRGTILAIAKAVEAKIGRAHV